jgi:hypothetical protein
MLKSCYEYLVTNINYIIITITVTITMEVKNMVSITLLLGVVVGAAL